MKKLSVLSLIFLLAAPDLALAQGQSRHGRGEDVAFAPRGRDQDGERAKGRGPGDGRRPRIDGQRADGPPGRGPREDGPPGQAPGGRGNRGGDARQEVREGRRVPLRDVIPNIQRRTPGRMLDSFAENGPGGRPQYRVRWQSDSGERIDYIVDAETGAIIRRE